MHGRHVELSREALACRRSRGHGANLGRLRAARACGKLARGQAHLPGAEDTHEGPRSGLFGFGETSQDPSAPPLQPGSYRLALTSDCYFGSVHLRSAGLSRRGPRATAAGDRPLSRPTVGAFEQGRDRRRFLGASGARAAAHRYSHRTRRSIFLGRHAGADGTRVSRRCLPA